MSVTRASLAHSAVIFHIQGPMWAAELLQPTFKRNQLENKEMLLTTQRTVDQPLHVRH